MKALVTGATGCVGSNIVEALLARGYEVRAMQRSTSRLDALDGLAPEMVVGDILDAPSLRAAMAGCDWVFHAAAVSQYWRNRPDLIYEVNVEGTRNVVQAAQAVGVGRLVYTSSVAALGFPESPGQILDESHAFNIKPGQFPYGYSKILAEGVVQSAVAEGLDAVIVNPVTVIGQRDVGFVGGEFLRAASMGLAVAAPPGGMGIVSARRLGEAHVLAAERGQTGERYILNGENVSYLVLTRTVAEVMGVRPPLFIVPRPVMGFLAVVVGLWNRLRRSPPLLDDMHLRFSTKQLYYDGSKARQELGFDGGSARAAVEEAWGWYQDQNLL
ncbi:MAG: NAD-dependent epimerase/dehydratase family protein [Anaerolineae bacterium]